MIRFNEEELFNKYKEIVETCITDGYALPVLIRDYNIPKEYKYTVKEKQKYYKKMTEKDKTLLYNMLRTRKETKLKILQGKNKQYKTIKEYYTDELKQFLKQYPIYQKIIMEE